MNLQTKLKGSFYTVGEEIGNAVSHGIGAILAIVGTVLLIIKAAGNPWNVIACAIYGASMILLFSISTLYHSITNERAKHIFRKLDHSSIFILIEGTYTPYTLISMHGIIGWTIFGIVWATAVFGIILNFISVERFKIISMICYIASGWCVIFAIVPLIRVLEWQGTFLLILGGVFYTVGTLFYRQKQTRNMHMIWHFFVLAGAILHYFSILLYVL